MKNKSNEGKNIEAVTKTERNNSNDSESNNNSLEKNDKKTKSSEEINTENNTDSKTETNNVDIDDGLKKRKDIADKYKWKLSKIYKNTESFKKDIKVVEDSFSTFDKFENTFVDSYENFYLILDLYQKTRRKTDNLFVYATLQSHTDTKNADFSDLEEIAAKV